MFYILNPIVDELILQVDYAFQIRIFRLSITFTHIIQNTYFLCKDTFYLNFQYQI